MSGKSRGGPREGAGRKSKPNPITWRDYQIIKIPKPANDREADALEWFKNLEPFERLQLIIRFYYGDIKK
jgi:hypothetical protein